MGHLPQYQAQPYFAYQPQMMGAYAPVAFEPQQPQRQYGSFQQQQQFASQGVNSLI